MPAAELLAFLVGAFGFGIVFGVFAELIRIRR